MAEISRAPTVGIGFSKFDGDPTHIEDGERMVVSFRSPRDSTASTLTMPEFSGQTIDLDGRYCYNDSLDSLIGLGAFGAVFKGHDRNNLNGVAVKRMSYVHIKENELKLIQSLKSRYLVGVMDICKINDGTCCLIMELCDGDLEHHIKHNSEDGRLSNINLSLIIDNIARGYKALFDLRIVHRDIKPQNILVKYEGKSKTMATAKITDFGIARTLEDGEPDLCNVAGTLFYMAPEVGANLLKTCQYDAQVDMWSIGCLIYQCVTGEIPFDEGSLCKLFLHTAGGNYEAYDPPELPENTPNEVRQIITSLLEIDSSRRCTANEFYETVIAFKSVIC